MPIDLTPYLEDLEARLDPAQEEAHRGAWEAFLAGEVTEGYFVPPTRSAVATTLDWPQIHTNDAIEDPDLTILSQLGGVAWTLGNGGNSAHTVRCNYGTAIMPSILGCEVYVMPRESDTLPTGKPLYDSDKVRELVDRGPAEPRNGLGAVTLDTGSRMRDLFAKYPNVEKYVHIYHPDAQGTVDIAEMVWGSPLFYAFYEETELMSELFEVITQTYIAFMREWFKIVPPVPACSPHWGMYHPGPIMLRDDSLMNISSEMYVEFVRDHDQRIFDEFGGGAIHFCGRNDHFIEAMSKMNGLHAINLSQPDMNDMETIWKHTVDKGIFVVGFDHTVAQQAIDAGRPLHGRVHGWSWM
jgi:hypothetical protein